MITANPSAVYEAVIQVGETGLVGAIGTRVNDNAGATTVAFSSATVTEIAFGVYSATGRSAPASAGQFTIIWTRGSGGEVLGIEDLLVTGAGVAGPVVPITGSLYQSRADIKSSGSIVGSFSDNDIDTALNAACRGIDLACGRPHGFYPDDDADNVRYYTPQAADRILIDDLIALTSLKTSQLGNNEFDRSWDLNQEFSLYPLNAALNGRPWTYIRINPWGAVAGFPFWAPRTVELTGCFGWAAAPAGIVEAAGLLTNRLLQRARSAPLGVMFNADIAMRIAFSDPDVNSAIKPFIREEIDT